MRIAGKVTTVTVALVAAATLGACANSEQDSTGTTTNKDCTADDVKVSGDFGSKPSITIPAGCQPPKTLLTKDLKPGTGDEVKAGTNLSANYQLVTWSDKKEVDGNFGDKPFTVENVGQGQVIKGWNEGLIGMKVNGRRLLIVPPDKGYGPNGSSPIKGNETLVFIVDATAVS